MSHISHVYNLMDLCYWVGMSIVEIFGGGLNWWFCFDVRQNKTSQKRMRDSLNDTLSQ